MNLQRWILQRKPDWEKLESRLARLDSQGTSGLDNEEILELGSLYRSISADLSRAKAHNVGGQIVEYLNSLTLRAHNHIYSTSMISYKDILSFFTTEFPRTFRKYFIEFMLTFSVFWIGAALAMITVHIDPVNASTLFVPQEVIENLQHGTFWTDNLDSHPTLSEGIMKNNIMVALRAFAFGIVFGIGSLIEIFKNGFFIGGMFQVVYENGLVNKITTFIAAHGVIELFTIYVAGAAGFIIGWPLISPGNLKRWDAVKLRIKDASKLAIGSVFLLIIAGTIEGLISPSPSIPSLVKYSIALLSALLLILYFAFAGRFKTSNK